jgi:isocitrate/isopropylmalate dehydrogenase
MKECICFSVIFFIIASLIANLNELNNKNVNSIYLINNTAIYSKDTLQQIVMDEELKIVNNIVRSITYGVLYEARHAKKTFQWKDNDNILNNKLYEKVIDEIITKFPDINIEEFDGYAITFDWQ